ncbi:hypothetical protein D3C85_773060 [compost metagenome]
MTYDRELEKHFFEYLISIGYPRNSIIYQPAIHPVQNMMCYRPSFALIDPKKNEHIAIIEVKECKIGGGSSIYKNMRDYSKAVGSDSIPVYIISTDYSDASPFLLHSLDDKGEIITIDHSLFPSFEALSAKESTDRKVDLRIRREYISDKFRKICWVASSLFFILVALDFFLKEFYDIGLLTAERISLLGGALALIVIPFAQKFKGLGIEWEKIVNSNESEPK